MICIIVKQNSKRENLTNLLLKIVVINQALQLNNAYQLQPRNIFENFVCLQLIVVIQLKGLVDILGQANDMNYSTLDKKCPYWEFFWSVFSRIRTEYKDIYSD